MPLSEGPAPRLCRLLKKQLSIRPSGRGVEGPTHGHRLLRLGSWRVTRATLFLRPAASGASSTRPRAAGAIIEPLGDRAVAVRAAVVSPDSARAGSSLKGPTAW